MILGTISEVDNTKGLTLVIDGEETPTEKKYSYLASYVPATGDRVLIEEISDTYVIVGKLITNYNDSGKARSVATADNATLAVTSHYVYSDTSYSTSNRIQFRVYNNRLQYASGISAWKTLSEG